MTSNKVQERKAEALTTRSARIRFFEAIIIVLILTAFTLVFLFYLLNQVSFHDRFTFKRTNQIVLKNFGTFEALRQHLANDLTETVQNNFSPQQGVNFKFENQLDYGNRPLNSEVSR